jgi:hypothetical protein
MAGDGFLVISGEIGLEEAEGVAPSIVVGGLGESAHELASSLVARDAMDLALGVFRMGKESVTFLAWRAKLRVVHILYTHRWYIDRRESTRGRSGERMAVSEAQHVLAGLARPSFSIIWMAVMAGSVISCSLMMLTSLG